MGAAAAILGCEGLELSAWERDFFRDADPWGFILFARNVSTPAQIQALTAALRETVGRDAPVLIDQEGGRVARLQPPHWQAWADPLPWCEALGPKAEEAMRLRYHVIGAELAALGIDVNCAPMADIAAEHSHAVIKSRCYGRDPAWVATIGRAVADGLALGGVLPVLKHIPGHGRADLDSHTDLPRIDAPMDQLLAEDFAPFKALSDLPMAMTAHIIFEALDGAAPATLSSPAIAAIRSEIGFEGLLMSDDISMEALAGPVETRATRALAAGCDMVLHCNGDKGEMQAIAGAVPRLAAQAAARAQAALARRQAPQPVDIAQASARLAALEGEHAHA